MKIFQSLGLEFGDFLAPYLIVLIAALFMSIGWWFVKNFVVWFSMKLKGYTEGEEVYLNDTPAIIMKLGFLSTSFMVQNGGGVVQRMPSISNTSMDGQKIERISLRITRLNENHEKSNEKPNEKSE